MLNITKAAEHSAGKQRIAQVEPLYLKTVKHWLNVCIAGYSM
jgi:hypothetical protein